MKKLLKRGALALALLIVAAFVFKAAQKLCWDYQVSIVAPPSLDSWDPTERIEAARQAARKFGGKQ